MAVGEPEDGVVQAELFGVQVEVVLGDIPSTNFVGVYWLAPVLVLDIWLGWDTLLGSADVVFTWQPWFEVTLASDVKTARPAEISWWTTPGVVSRERCRWSVCRVGN